MNYQRKTKYPPRPPQRFNYEGWMLVLALIGIIVVLVCECCGVIPQPQNSPDPSVVVQTAEISPSYSWS